MSKTCYALAVFIFIAMAMNYAATGNAECKRRRWKKGDVVQVFLTMPTSIEQMPNVPDYIAFLHGPVLLGAKTGTDDLKGLIADDSRWGQFAAGEKLPVDEAPVIIADDRSETADALMPVKDKPLTITAPALKLINPAEIVFEPFFRIHDTKYMMYWRIVTNEQFKSGTGLLN